MMTRCTLTRLSVVLPAAAFIYLLQPTVARTDSGAKEPTPSQAVTGKTAEARPKWQPVDQEDLPGRGDKVAPFEASGALERGHPEGKGAPAGPLQWGACCMAVVVPCKCAVHDMTEVTCGLVGGTFFGVGTICETVNCDCNDNGICDKEEIAADPTLDSDGNEIIDGCELPRACCFWGGSCATIEPGECVSSGGGPRPLGSVCLGDFDGNEVDDACESPEACCFSDGSCANLGTGECVFSGGSPQAPWLVCLGDEDGNGVDDACGPPEACCSLDGTCIDTAPLLCVGAPQGAGSACLGDLDGNGIDDSCGETEACCRPTGTCADVTPSWCVALNGRSQGPGSACLGDLDGNGIDDTCCWDCELYGDVFPFDPQDPACGVERLVGNCVVDIDDLLVILAAFSESPNHRASQGGNYPGTTNLFPCGQLCADGVVDIDDVVASLFAFAGIYACPHVSNPGACCGNLTDNDGNPTTCLDWDQQPPEHTPPGGMSCKSCDELLGVFIEGAFPDNAICLGDGNGNGIDDLCE